MVDQHLRGILIDKGGMPCCGRYTALGMDPDRAGIGTWKKDSAVGVSPPEL